MKKRTSILVFLALFLSFLLAGGTSSGKEGEFTQLPSAQGIQPLKPGEKAPLFTIDDLQGNPFSLESYVGQKPVFLFFWSFFCGPCREEIPLINRLTKEYSGKGLVVVGVNLDGKEMAKAIEKFKEQEGLSYKIAFDVLEGDSFRVADPYGVVGTPTLFLIDKSGTIRYSHVGAADEGQLRKVIEEVLKD
ncbi:MAG: TlpA family protein disulfide reductase [Deltaproteobacteria bacterium]|nr:MAG: TlpA family protein disulfide reductase [Deltaproteobacteria bacterium]